MRIRVYERAAAGAWDAAVDASRNGTFLHTRGFMDYHADRFVDASVLVFDATQRLRAVFPANAEGDRVASHGGLTYGGLLLDRQVGQREALEALAAIGAHYRERGFRTLHYKPVPHVFHRLPCEDDLYAAFRLGMSLVSRNAASVIDLRAGAPRFAKGRKWSVNKSAHAGLRTVRSNDPADFHRILADTLRRHDRSPVHSVDEMRLLMERFADRIALYESRAPEGEILAGAWVFDFGHAVHTQYLANTESGRELGALDGLIAHLITETYADRSAFSFGISTERGGAVLNEGLVAQKEAFGAHTVTFDAYEWNLTASPPPTGLS